MDNTYARFRVSTNVGSVIMTTGQAPDGEVEDYLVIIDKYDFGDAPDGPYPTILTNNGARHKIIPGFFMDDTVDAELDGQPNANGLGDDNKGVPDEDGVEFTTGSLVVGQKAKITVKASDSGMLDAWIDFNDDGDWLDAGEQIFRSQPLVTGSNVLLFTVPNDAKATSQTFARFRFSSQGGLSFDGPADDGEVEDYEIGIITLDFGDAPDDPKNLNDYPTLLFSDGARHIINSALYLGEQIDADADGQPKRGADGDDITGVDDEDGLEVGDTIFLTAGESPSIDIKVVNNSGKMAYVTGWIDYNGDGKWEVSERAIGFALTSGTVTLKFLQEIPITAIDTTYARFRVSTNVRSVIMPTGQAPDGEVEDYLVINEKYDFGDAPDDSTNAGDYPTLLVSNGAYHRIKSGFYLGKSVDPEFDAQPNSNATGDDINGILDDKDGVVFNTIPLIVCRQDTITVTASRPGMLDAWIDFNADGDWTDAGEQIFTSQPLAAGANILSFKVPSDVTQTTQTFARFHFSSKGGLSFAGAAEDGEVEDYEVEIIGYDFGDAPDDPQNPDDYPTVLQSGGVRHKIKPGFYLGKYIDIEGDGQPDPKAEGDDKNSIDDEDGVVFSNMPLIVCRQDTITITASQTGMMDAWIDFNDDGDWTDIGEQIFKAQPFVAGANILIFTVPPDAKPTSQTFARFRFSSVGGLSFEGEADDGEVEDYVVQINGFDFGDAPDDPQNPNDYPTLLKNGAYHKIKAGFFLGDTIDAEFDGQPDPNAQGDNNNGLNDERGVNFTTLPLTACKQETVIVKASQAGRLDAWIDFNDDDDWADEYEQIFKSESLNDTINYLFFLVPDSATPTPQTFARFRFSSNGGLPYFGPADDGEVEDYDLSIISLDFGDAPDDPQNPGDYPTLSKSNGARHIIKSGFYLDNGVDCEGNGQPHPHALGDVPDEDGVVFNPMPLIIGRPASITVTASDTGKLDAWIDFDDNDDWAGADEQIFANTRLMPGSHILTFTVPLTADTTSQTFARFRFSSEGNLSYDGLAQDGEVEDYEVEIIGFDFGNAPDDTTNSVDYPTYSLSNGAHHKIKPGFFLGDSIDAEADGQTDDNAFNFKDEDGVDFHGRPLIIGGKAQITVTASDSGILDAWIDFSGSGSWNGANAQIFNAQPLSAGTTIVTFNVPDEAKPTSQTFARFRFSSQGGLSYEGYPEEGEVEDYPLETIAADFGDAPDDSIYHYATLLDNSGACHKIKPGFYLGAGVDFEEDGKQNRGASGDNFDDGVEFKTNPLVLCNEAQMVVTASSDSGKLYAWLDSDCDGNWEGEHKLIFDGEPLTAGRTVLTFPVPSATNPECSTFVRFRFSSQDSLSYEGFAEDGEVEDYKVEIQGFDFGDAPDPYNDHPGRYPTLLDYDGAHHKIDSRLYLGNCVDADTNGQPTTNKEALGDDRTHVDDEDGLRNENGVGVDTLRLKICTYPTIPVKVHNATEKNAYVIFWIDFDGRYGWTGHEKVMAIAQPGADSVLFYFGKIRSYWKDTTYARIRISTVLDSVDRPWSFAPDGEVEDYLVIISRSKVVNLASLEATAENGKISINWSTENEPFNEQFIIYRSHNDSTDFIKINPEIIHSQGDSITGAAYQFIDEPTEIGTYYYKLESVSPDSYSTFHGPIMVKLMTTVAMEKEALIPKEYSLSQNYPNPFNPETHIKYAIPKDGHVTIEIYDVLGRLVKRLEDEHKPAGYYQVIWNARNDNGNVVSNGVYLLRMKSGTFISIKKMILVK